MTVSTPISGFADTTYLDEMTKGTAPLLSDPSQYTPSKSAKTRRTASTPLVSFSTLPTPPPDALRSLDREIDLEFRDGKYADMSLVSNRKIATQHLYLINCVWYASQVTLTSVTLRLAHVVFLFYLFSLLTYWKLSYGTAHRNCDWSTLWSPYARRTSVRSIYPHSDRFRLRRLRETRRKMWVCPIIYGLTPQSHRVVT